MSTTTREIKKLSTALGTDPFGAIVSALNRHGSFSADLGSIASGAVGSVAVDVSAQHNSDDALEAGDEVICIPESIPDAGLVLESAEVTGADEITVRVLNTTAGAIDPVAFNVYFHAPLTLAEL